MAYRRPIAASALLAVTSGLLSGIGPSATPASAAATVSCRTGYAPADPPALSAIPDANIGQIGMRPAVPGKPSWDGDDRINDSAYVRATNVVYLVGWFDVYNWHGVGYERHNAVAINATTGEPTAWAPDVDGEILADQSQLLRRLSLHRRLVPPRQRCSPRLRGACVANGRSEPSRGTRTQRDRPGPVLRLPAPHRLR